MRIKSQAFTPSNNRERGRIKVDIAIKLWARKIIHYQPKLPALRCVFEKVDG